MIGSLPTFDDVEDFPNIHDHTFGYMFLFILSFSFQREYVILDYKSLF